MISTYSAYITDYIRGPRFNDRVIPGRLFCQRVPGSKIIRPGWAGAGLHLSDEPKRFSETLFTTKTKSITSALR